MSLRRFVPYTLHFCVLAVWGATVGVSDDNSADEYPRAISTPPTTLKHFIEVAPGLYSGGEPSGTESFSELQELGVTVVVSVDGARPDVESAAHLGIRYVHVPFGYDGIPEKAAAALTRVMREADGPVYVHCHHGRHRGPAAAAVCGLADGSLDQAAARRLLELAETSPDYSGLWRDVAGFEPLPADAELPALVEIAEVESLATTMARISRNFDRLEEFGKRDWLAEAASPDEVPHRVSLLVSEDLKECRRLTNRDDPEFQQLMSASASAAAELTDALRDGHHDQADEHLRMLERSCAECHASYRN